MPVYNYPENIIRAIGVSLVCGKDIYVPLSDDQLTDLEEKINSLSIKYRSALLLHYRDGMTYQRIADENGFVSLASAYGVVHTAVARLRRLYEGKKPRRTTSSRDGQSKEQVSHELAVARNDRGVYIDTAGEGWFEGFAAPKASEFFGSSDHPRGGGGAEAPAEGAVDNMDGGM